jgi:hypothetical protein
MYSKLMVIIPHIPVCRVIRRTINFVYILHAHAFASLTFVNILSTTFFTKSVRVHVQQSVYRESCKYAYFGIQNSCANVGK